jgi:uncharacterized RDD family membrane protein YckC
MAQATNIGSVTKSYFDQDFRGEIMSLDIELRKLPSASPWQRFGVYILDRLLVVAAALIPGAIAFRLTQNFSNESIAMIINALAFIGGIIFVAMQGIYFRVGDTGQTFGMSLMGVAMASDTSEFKSSFMNRIFAWAHMDVKGKENSWGGEENEGRSDAQLWRGLLPWVIFPLSFALIALLVRVLVGIPFVLASWWSGELNLNAVNENLFFVIVAPLAIIFVLTELGFLFCLGSERRTLVDHFLGIKLVDTRGTEFHYKKSKSKSLWKWISGTDFSYDFERQEELVSR